MTPPTSDGCESTFGTVDDEWTHGKLKRWGTILGVAQYRQGKIAAEILGLPLEVKRVIGKVALSDTKGAHKRSIAHLDAIAARKLGVRLAKEEDKDAAKAVLFAEMVRLRAKPVWRTRHDYAPILKRAETESIVELRKELLVQMKILVVVIGVPQIVMRAAHLYGKDRRGVKDKSWALGDLAGLLVGMHERLRMAQHDGNGKPGMIKLAPTNAAEFKPALVQAHRKGTIHPLVRSLEQKTALKREARFLGSIEDITIDLTQNQDLDQYIADMKGRQAGILTGPCN